MTNRSPIKTIAAFTGNRAEYGLLYPILKAIHQHPDLKLYLIVGGDHTRLGTIAEIEADGLPIAVKLEYNDDFSGLAPQAMMIQATADLLSKMQQVFTTAENSLPDLFLVLGDRYESFAATLAAFYSQIPIAHIGGGDVTEGGCVDDTLRFVMSQLAHLHFVISQDSADRLIQRGEESWRVYITGSPVIDNLKNTVLADKLTLCKEYDVQADYPIVLFTQHPIPAEGGETVEYFRQSVQALAELGESNQVQVIATRPNLDGFGNRFDEIIQYSKTNHSNLKWVDSLGRMHYLSWLAACDVVLGNSSSGLIETPFFKKPSITVGPRQKGRQRAENVLESDYGVAAVKAAVLKVLQDEQYLRQVQSCHNPFGEQPCAPRICELLLASPTREQLLAKRFVAGVLEQADTSGLPIGGGCF